MKLKKLVKKLHDHIFDFFFKRRFFFTFLRLYPRSKNYVYDIINFKCDKNIKLIFDIGANMGQSALYFRKLLKKAQIHCFEPITSTFKTLTTNTQNDFNIFRHNIAFGEKKTSLNIPYIPNSGLNSLVEEVNKVFDKKTKQIVNINTIDNFIENNRIEHIDIMKIDTEGYDLNVLHGADKTLTEQKVDFIICEVGFLYEKSKGDFDKINLYMHEKGYWLSGFYDNYYWGNKYILHGFTNAMYIKKELAFTT